MKIAVEKKKAIDRELELALSSGAQILLIGARATGLNAKDWTSIVS